MNAISAIVQLDSTVTFAKEQEKIKINELVEQGQLLC